MASSSRDEFLGRVDAAMTASCLQSAQNSSLHQNSQSNRTAQIIRNGLMVIIFCSVEDFLKNRTAELLRTSELLQIPVSTLPDNFLNAVTNNAIAGISFHRRRILENAGISGLSTEAELVARATDQGVEFSQYSFFNENSNIAAEQISKVLKVLCRRGVMDSFLDLYNSIGGTPTTSIKDDFERFAAARHRAAHDMRSAVQASDLQTWINFSRRFCFSFDCLSSGAIASLSKIIPDSPYNASSLKKFNISAHSQGFALYSAPSLRAKKVESDISTLKIYAEGRINRTDSVCYSLNSSGTPDWWTTCLG